MRRYLMIAILAMVPTTTGAEDLRYGWGFQFVQDTFDKTIVPMSMLAEEGTGSGRSSLFVVCDAQGNLTPIFQEAIITLENSTRVAFLDGDRPQIFEFTIRELPHFSRRLALDPQDSATLLSLFEKADGVPVAYRTNDSQGTFLSIGAEKAFALMRENCPR